MSPDPVFDILTHVVDKLTEIEPPALAPCSIIRLMSILKKTDSLLHRSTQDFSFAPLARDYQSRDIHDLLVQGFQFLRKRVVDHPELEVVFEPGRVQDQHFVLGVGEPGQVTSSSRSRFSGS